MNLKVLFIVFLCFLSLSLVSNVAMVVVNVTEEGIFKASTDMLPTSYPANNGTDPMYGDPVGPGWP